jgi:uncharacterized protein YbaR (Trm112 family)
MASIDLGLLEMLACPVPECRAALRPAEAVLVCTGCGLRYRIEQSWPVLIPEEAEPPGGADAPGAKNADAESATKKT